jgi:adenylate cyclase
MENSMAVEIERKFLVNGDLSFLDTCRNVFIQQGYLNIDPEKTVRVRTLENVAGKSAFITVKGKTVGISKPEFEYRIPPKDAEEMFKLCGDRVIEKTRYFLPHGNFTWEIDVFSGKHRTLVIAEIELKSEDDVFDIPEWIGREVTTDHAYSNSSLANWD